MRPWEIIQKLETDNSRLFKESVVAEHIDNAEFKTGLQYALDPLVTFGVQQVPTWEGCEIVVRNQIVILVIHVHLNKLKSPQTEKDFYQSSFMKLLICLLLES